MLHRGHLTELFGVLALKLPWRSATRTSDLHFAEILGKTSGPPNERTRALELDVGTRLYLVSLGVVSAAIVVVFFGLGFFLLANPDERHIAGVGDRDGGVKVVEPQPSALFTAQKEVLHAATAPAPSVPSAAHEVSPAGSRDTASTAGVVTANATFDAPPSPERPRLGSNTATLATSAGVTHPQRNWVGRHRYARTRTHWAGANGRPPPSVSGPEKAWHWIVQSATSILAALSPPPSRQAPALRTR